MSFAPGLGKFLNVVDAGMTPITNAVTRAIEPGKPPTPPLPPNQNDALNQAQSLTDSMRMRRGMLANIYAGGSAAQPVTGKTQLGA